MPALGDVRGSDRPGENVDILLFEKQLEPIQIGVAPSGMMRVEKAADEHVRLAYAAMPGAELQAFDAGVAVHISHV